MHSINFYNFEERRKIDIRKKFKINILTIKRGEEVFIPAPDTVIETDDIAFVIGEVRDIQKCFRI